MANCKWGFYVFYRKVAILSVSKDILTIPQFI